jgi:hypothetical protein
MISDMLTEKERNLLIHCLKDHKPRLVDQISALQSGVLDPDTVNEMRDAVGKELAAKGFLKGDRSSRDYGIELDGLISRIADLYLWPREKKTRQVPVE